MKLGVIYSQIKSIKKLCSEFGVYKGLKVWRFYKYIRIKKRNLDLSNKIVFVNGYKMSLLPNDDGISTELALFNIHEPLNTQLIAKNLNKGMICFDIGANIGYYTLLESKIIGDSGKIIAIEPSPLNFQQLKKNYMEIASSEGLSKYRAFQSGKKSEYCEAFEVIRLVKSID